MNRREEGMLGEAAAARYLEEKGYRVLARNLREGKDETDLLAQTGNTLVFCEVKTRRQYPDLPDRFGSPGDAVDARKRAALIRGAETYLAEHPETAELFVRIDVIEVYAAPEGEEFRVLEIRQTENAVRKTGKFSRSARSSKTFDD